MLLLVMYMDKSLKKNILDFKEMFSSSADFTIREFKINTPKGKNAAVFTMEGMCNKETLAISVINPIMGCRYRSDNGCELLEVIKTSVITASEMVDVKDTEMFLTLLMSGFAIIAVDGCENMLAIGLQGFSFRSVSEPSGETIQINTIKGITAEAEKASSAQSAKDAPNGEDEDEVTEEEYREYLREKRERQKKLKARKRHTRTFTHILGGVLLSVFIVSISLPTWV